VGGIRPRFGGVVKVKQWNEYRPHYLELLRHALLKVYGTRASFRRKLRSTGWRVEHFLSTWAEAKRPKIKEEKRTRRKESQRGKERNAERPLPLTRESDTGLWS